MEGVIRIHLSKAFKFIICAVACAWPTLTSAQDVLEQTAPQIDSASQGSQCLALANIIHLAQSNSPEVDVAQSEYGAAVARYDETKSFFRPQLSSFVRTARGDDGLVNSQFSNQFGFRASQRLYDFGDSRLARRAAKSDADASFGLVEQAQFDAAYQAVLDYIAWLEAQALLQVTAERERYFTDQRNALSRALKAGEATRSEIAKLDAEIASADSFRLNLNLKRIKAETNIRNTTQSVSLPCASMADALRSTLVVPISSQSVESLLLNARRHNPQLRSLEDTARSLEHTARRRARERLPAIELVGIASLAGDSEFNNMEFRESLGIDITVPILTGSALTARTAQARARAGKAKAEVASRQRDLQTEVESTYQKLFLLEAQLETYGAVNRARSEELNALQKEFDAGLQTLSELVDAKLKSEAALIETISLKHDLLRAGLTLKYMTGDL